MFYIVSTLLTKLQCDENNIYINMFSRTQLVNTLCTFTSHNNSYDIVDTIQNIN